MIGKDVGVRSFLCKPQSGDAKEPLFFFFSCVEQIGMEKDRAGGRDGTALVYSDLQDVCRSGRDNRKRNRARC